MRTLLILLVLASPALAGCLEGDAAPPTAPAQEEPEMSAPAEAAGDAPDEAAPVQETLPVGARTSPDVLWEAARAAADAFVEQTDVAKDGLYLWTIDSDWTPAGSGEALLVEEFRETAPRHPPEADGRELLWKFDFTTPDASRFYTVYVAAGGVVVDQWFAGWPDPYHDTDRSPVSITAEQLDTALLIDALSRDPTASDYLSAPLRSVRYVFDAWQQERPPSWGVAIATPGSTLYAHVDPATWQVVETHVEEESLPLRVISGEGIRENLSAGIGSVSYVIAHDGRGEPVNATLLDLRYEVHGWNRLMIQGNRSTMFQLEWIEGDEADGHIGPGESVRLTYRPPEGELGPGEHVGVRILGDGDRDRDASFATPDDYAGQLVVPLRLP